MHFTLYHILQPVLQAVCKPENPIMPWYSCSHWLFCLTWMNKWVKCCDHLSVWLWYFLIVMILDIAEALHVSMNSSDLDQISRQHVFSDKIGKLYLLIKLFSIKGKINYMSWLWPWTWRERNSVLYTFFAIWKSLFNSFTFFTRV